MNGSGNLTKHHFHLNKKIDLIKSDIYTMDAVSFDDMFELLLTTDTVDIAAQPQPAIAAPEPVIMTPIRAVNRYDTECNILDNAIKTLFENDIGTFPDAIFTQPEPTTFTMEGFLTNVRFNEEQFINDLTPTNDVVMLNCNFGKKIHHSYTEPVIEKKNNRGRKKKEKVQNKRKIQGSGKCFNSQISFVVRSGVNKDGGEIAPGDDPVYKFKVFRNGKLQLPGGKPVLINDIIDKVRHVVDILNTTLHRDEVNPTQLVSVININPVMKNYKFLIRLQPNEIIDLMMLKHILFEHRRAEKPEAPNRPPIIDINYTRESTKNAITFATPIRNKPKKVTKLNLFMSGKVNILGAYHSHVARSICEYLQYIFDTYPQLIVSDFISNIKPVEIKFENELLLTRGIIIDAINKLSADQLKSLNEFIAATDWLKPNF